MRNIRPGFAKFGLWGGLINAAVDTYVFRGRAPWTLRQTHPDNTTLLTADAAPRIAYPKPDGKLTFDRLSWVFISNTNHEENQPVHLRLRDPARAIAVNWAQFRSPEIRCIARPASMKSLGPRRARRVCRSTRRTACTARPATSRIRRRISTG